MTSPCCKVGAGLRRWGEKDDGVQEPLSLDLCDRVKVGECKAVWRKRATAVNGEGDERV